MPAWIHDRAKHIQRKNPDMPEGQAFAIATQQAHKLGKTPKGYGTKEGKATARAKYSLPRSEYRKTADRVKKAAHMVALQKRANMMMGYPSTPGAGGAGVGGAPSPAAVPQMKPPPAPPVRPAPSAQGAPPTTMPMAQSGPGQMLKTSSDIVLEAFFDELGQIEMEKQAGLLTPRFAGQAPTRLQRAAQGVARKFGWAPKTHVKRLSPVMHATQADKESALSLARHAWKKGVDVDPALAQQFAREATEAAAPAKRVAQTVEKKPGRVTEYLARQKQRPQKEDIWQAISGHPDPAFMPA